MPFSVTRITRALSLLTGTNSICFSLPPIFGATTMLAQSESPDSSSLALLHKSSIFFRSCLLFSLFLHIQNFYSPNLKKSIDKELRPKSVGTLPAGVWFDFNNPDFCKSYITFLMEAGDSCSPIFKDKFLEPTGFPVLRNRQR